MVWGNAGVLVCAIARVCVCTCVCVCAYVCACECVKCGAIQVCLCL